MKRTMVATERLLEELRHGVLAPVDLTLWNLTRLLSGMLVIFGAFALGLYVLGRSLASP